MSHLGLLTEKGEVDEDAITDFLNCEDAHLFMGNEENQCHAMSQMEDVNHYFESWQDMVNEVKRVTYYITKFSYQTFDLLKATCKKISAKLDDN